MEIEIFKMTYKNKIIKKEKGIRIVGFELKEIFALKIKNFL